MSDFRCPRYWWDGSQWRCQNLPNDYLSSYDFDTYCTNKNRCLECPYMDSEVREKVAAYKKEVEEHVEEQRREYEAEQRNRENNNTSSTTTYSSSDSSDTGSFSALFSLVVHVIGGLLKLLWPIIKVYFLALMLPNYVAATWVGCAVGVLAFRCMDAGLRSLTVIFAVIMSVPALLFCPYWVILMWQKIKKQMTWKEVCSHYWKWFLKGPVAYIDFANFLNATNTMPKVANLLGIIIGWFKKVFKKK